MLEGENALVPVADFLPVDDLPGVDAPELLAAQASCGIVLVDEEYEGLTGHGPHIGRESPGAQVVKLPL